MLTVHCIVHLHFLNVLQQQPQLIMLKLETQINLANIKHTLFKKNTLQELYLHLFNVNINQILPRVTKHLHTTVSVW